MMTNVGSCQVFRSLIMSWGCWTWLVSVDNLLKCFFFLFQTQSFLLWNNQNVRSAIRHCKQWRCTCFWGPLSPPLLCLTCWLADGRWVCGEETLFIEWSDLFCLHPIHLSSPPWQFSLGTGFNMGQNAICIYISFFIRPGPLSPLKILGIWGEISGRQFKRLSLLCF